MEFRFTCLPVNRIEISDNIAAGNQRLHHHVYGCVYVVINTWILSKNSILCHSPGSAKNGVDAEFGLTTLARKHSGEWGMYEATKGDRVDLYLLY